MTQQQLIDFDARREAVLRHQLKVNPKFRAMRRDRRVAIAAGVVRYAVAVGIALFLLKAFVISQNGADGYLALVAPVLQQVPADGFVAQVLAPDAYSVLVAETFAGFVTPDTQAAQSGLDGIERVGPSLPRS